MNFTLKVWRQKDAKSPGEFKTYPAKNISSDASFLEMLDIVNNELDKTGEPCIAFDHDCREGICGMCSLQIDGIPHGPKIEEKPHDPNQVQVKGEDDAPRGRTTCQLYMREFKDGETITIEPFRAKAFPIVRDLICDRSAFDRIIRKGGYNAVNVGNAPDANAMLCGKAEADQAMDAATCIGCGACVASCKNASAMLFVSAKIGHLGRLPQGQPERYKRVVAMVDQMDKEGFGNCTNEGECEAACPKKISLNNIHRMNKDFIWAKIFG